MNGFIGRLTFIQEAMPQHSRPPRRLFRWLFLYQPHFITPSSILLLLLIISLDIFKLVTYWQFVIRVHCSAELHTLILKWPTARAWPLPGQGKSTWKELRRSDPMHGGSWGAAVKPALSKSLSLAGWQNDHPWFHTHRPLPVGFYLMLWGAEEWGHTVNRFGSPEPDPITQADSSSHVVQHVYFLVSLLMWAQNLGGIL